MTIKLRIIHAVAGGCRSTREVATRLGLGLSSVNAYLYEWRSNRNRQLVNGQYIVWEPGKGRTLRPARPLAFLIRDGQPVGVGFAERVSNPSEVSE